ncbi:hypothetical protein DAPPUDRAFT_329652 [Daphnia pulex]|uniref:FLYWCH-type domain-containing protein n=1 Tax=Daphnia pulex TaxID=6669 RepID=E9HH94_DAPPU|nr:hypothetical protein DAPPUDRAFT_329652 [Daphnia pulex]|eukprot:EFX68906.1 hypothetical protein DAPPUDRAFT_329652 [Daphnia pulex]
MAEEHQVVQVSVDPGTRRNTVRYNTECGYFFYKKEQRGDVLRLECNRRKQGCPCKIYMRDGIFMQHGEHNHENEVEEQNRALAVRECEIIAAVEKRIQRAKRARQPPTPNSVDEMLASMENRPDYTRTINGEQFFHDSVYPDHENEVPGVRLVFLSLFLLQFLGEATLIILDGTFHTVPTLFYQLLTIHVVVLYYPFAFALMTRKTKNLYLAVLRLVAQIV